MKRMRSTTSSVLVVAAAVLALGGLLWVEQRGEAAVTRGSTLQLIDAASDASDRHADSYLPGLFK